MYSDAPKAVAGYALDERQARRSVLPALTLARAVNVELGFAFKISGVSGALVV